MINKEASQLYQYFYDIDAWKYDHCSCVNGDIFTKKQYEKFNKLDQFKLFYLIQALKTYVRIG